MQVTDLELRIDFGGCFLYSVLRGLHKIDHYSDEHVPPLCVWQQCFFFV